MFYNTKKTVSTIALLLILLVTLLIVTVPCVIAAEDYWTTMEPMPTARIGFGVTVVDGKIYAIGGSNGSSLLDVVEEYDPTTDTWTTKQSMPTARLYPAIAVYKNKIYVIGGIIGESDPDFSGFTGAIEVYDPLTDTWETKDPMHTARAGLCANVVGEKIYLIGGLQYWWMWPFQQYTGANEAYDPLNEWWFIKTPMPTVAYGFASAVVDNKIYVMGGILNGHTTSINQIYNPETDSWSYGENMSTAVFSAAVGATTGVMAPKRIYVFGGENPPPVATNLTQVYDLENDVWTTGTPMPTPRTNLGVVVVNDELYAIGGYDGDTCLTVNEKYTPLGYIPEFPSWTPLLIMLIAVVAVAVFYRHNLHKQDFKGRYL